MKRVVWQKPWSYFTKLALGLSLSVLFLYLTLKGVRLSEVWYALKSANPTYLFIAFILGLMGNVFRAVRWGNLFNTKPRMRILFTSMMIGYLANNILPARLGELVRIYVLQRKAGLSKAKSTATVILERLVDALLLLLLVALSSFVVTLPSIIQNSSRVAAMLMLILALLLLLMVFRAKLVAKLILKMTGFFSRGLENKVEGILEHFVEGLGVLKSSRQTFGVLLLTLVVWGIEAISVWLVIEAMHLQVPWIAAVLVLVVISLSFIIPSAPGAVGTYEFFAVIALTPFAVLHAQAVGLALALHAVTYIGSTLVGLICLWVESLSLWELKFSASKG